MYGMTDLEESSWTRITDSYLNRIVQEIQKLTPNIGQAQLLGALRSRGLHCKCSTMASEKLSLRL